MCCPLGAPLCAPCALGLDTYEALLAPDCPESHMLRFACMRQAISVVPPLHIMLTACVCFVCYFTWCFLQSPDLVRIWGAPVVESQRQGSHFLPPRSFQPLAFSGFSWAGSRKCAYTCGAWRRSTCGAHMHVAQGVSTPLANSLHLWRLVLVAVGKQDT